MRKGLRTEDRRLFNLKYSVEYAVFMGSEEEFTSYTASIA